MSSVIIRSSQMEFPAVIFSGTKTIDLKLAVDFENIDNELDNFIRTNLSTVKYDQILLPISFGNSLSDFLGLRLSCHIRLTSGCNQLSNIYVYSYVNHRDLLDNECFNILKTKGVFYIDYNEDAFKQTIKVEASVMNKIYLINEIKKIKLSIPQNYYDNHSIANEWAIHKWNELLGDTNVYDPDIELINSKINTNLYFKYLRALNTLDDEDQKINTDNLKLNKGGKILYIDDEANKGWFELFCKIFVDNKDPKIELDVLDDEFNEKDQKEIISICRRKIESTPNYPDVILLDFRLHPDDFEHKIITDNTGYLILKMIKSINPGIQVIIFSATNKIWNFQKLQKIGADNFIVKEGVKENPSNQLTRETIIEFISHLNTGLNRSFLKEFFIHCSSIKKNLNVELIDESTSYQDFIFYLKKQLELIQESGKKIDLEHSLSLDIVFLNCYNFLEQFKHQYLREISHQIVLGYEEVEMNRYYEYNGKIINDGKFLRNNKYDKPSFFNCLTGLFIDYFSLATTGDNEVMNLHRVKEKRNDYIHGSKKKFNQKEIIMILELCVTITSRLRE